MPVHRGCNIPDGHGAKSPACHPVVTCPLESSAGPQPTEKVTKVCGSAAGENIAQSSCDGVLCRAKLLVAMHRLFTSRQPWSPSPARGVLCGSSAVKVNAAFPQSARGVLHVESDPSRATSATWRCSCAAYGPLELKDAHSRGSKGLAAKARQQICSRSLIHLGGLLTVPPCRHSCSEAQ